MRGALGSHMDLRRRQRDWQPLFVWDFTTMSPGGIVMPTGMTFTRASSRHSVQIDANTLVTSGLGTDVPAVGRLSSAHSLGLFVEPARTNRLYASSAFDGSYWGRTAGLTITSPEAPPTGSGTAQRVAMDASTRAVYGVVPGNGFRVLAGTESYTISAWLKRVSGAGAGPLQIGMRNGTSTAGIFAGSATVSDSAWARYAASKSFVLADVDVYAIPTEGANRTALGGLSAAARDGLVWGVQQEAGMYPTSLIPTTTTSLTRAGERAAIDSTRAAASVVNGRLGVYLKLRALAASTELAATEGTLLAWLTGSVYVDPTSLFLKAIDGSTYSQTANAVISWSRYDLLEFAIEVGAGKSAMRWRVNGGATNAAVFSTRDDTIGALNLSAGLDFCNTAAAGQMPSIVEKLIPFVPSRALF